MITMNKAMLKEQKERGDKPLLVEYWAPWCGYCRRIAPAMKGIAEKYDSLTVGQVDMDQDEALWDEEEIEVIPTLVLYQGGKVLGSIVVPESRGQIERFIQETLNG